MPDIFMLDTIPSGCMPTKEVWVGSERGFLTQHCAAGDNFSINYGAPIPAYQLTDAAALLEYIIPARWVEFTKLMRVRYGADITGSPLIPIILKGLADA